MIECISLTNFKLFRDKTVFDHLKQINLLTGVNGRGKSTLLQSMLLIKQTLLQSDDVRRLILNGQYVSLGNVLDVKNQESMRDDAVVFSFTNDGKEFVFSYNVNEMDDQVLVLSDIVQNASRTGLHRVQYISAERIGPRLQYEKSTSDFIVGAQGEYAVDVLERSIKNDRVVSESFVELMSNLYSLEPDEVERGVSEQIEFWMTKMFGHTIVDVKSIEEANVDVMKIGALKSHGSKPTNVGFGFTYAFPLLVAGLTANAGDILIIENPEAHLHPSAQSVIAKFLAFVAKQGVQLFIETHSEHILNAYRVLIKQEQLEHDDVNVMFFDPDFPEHYKDIPIDGKGKMAEWPNGFFDQAEKDLNILLDL